MIIKTNHGYIFGNTFAGFSQCSQDANGSFIIPGKNCIKFYVRHAEIQNGGVGDFTIEFPGQNQLRIILNPVCFE